MWVWSALAVFLAKKTARHMVLVLEISPLDTKNAIFETVYTNLNYKLNRKTYEVGFWCVRNLRCRILKIVLGELQGGAQGGLTMSWNTKSRTKKTPFLSWKWLYLVSQPPWSPPLILWKKSYDNFPKNIPVLSGGGLSGGAPGVKKPDFREKKVWWPSYTAKSEPPLQPPLATVVIFGFFG